MSSVEGRVLVHGEDEQPCKQYLMLEGVDARVHLIEYTREWKRRERGGELRTNNFARLRRILIDNESTLQIEDLGDSRAFLKNERYLGQRRRKCLNAAFCPPRMAGAVGLANIKLR